ncbi:MAG: UbiD family decarboxylase [Bacillota bacterium]
MAQIKDLRSFIDVMREAGQLFEIEKEVSLKHELGNVLATLEKENLGAGYFKKVSGHSMPVIGGVLGNQDRIALALNCKKEEIVEVTAKAFDNPLKPVRVDAAPCHENVLMGEAVDLAQLPIPIHAAFDAGAFITGGVIVSKGIDGTTHNLSFQRMQVKGKDKLSIMINEWRHLKEFYDEAESQGKGLPIAVVIGVDPVIMIAAGYRYDGDETELAGALRGAPIEVVKCKTSDIYVPATSEIVIEAEIIPYEREPEGPLGEFTGHYSEPWDSPTLKVKAICHRNNPIYQTIAGASYEHINLGNVLPREPLLKKFTAYVSKNVVNVHIPPYGGGFLALVQLKKTNPGEPKNVALAAMTAYVNIKNVIVVDPDVDIYNPGDIMWALSTRVKPEKDIFYVPNSQGHELDPTSDSRGVQTKMGIDATLAEENKDYKRVVYSKVNLKDYMN